MKLFVTGGTGFIGSHFLEMALTAGHQVVALRRNESRPVIPLSNEPEWVNGDLEQVLNSSLRGCDSLIHFASHGVTNPSESTWEDCFRWNVTASLKLWLQAAEAGVRRFLICGSCFEYGKVGEHFEYIPTTAPLEPTAPYHASKAAATMAALGFAVDKNTEVVILRPFHVYGEGEASGRFWPSLRRAAIAGEDFPMSQGLQVRDFINVEDVAADFVKALQRTDIRAGQPVIENLGSGTPKSLREFAREEWRRCGATGKLLLGTLPMRPNEVMRFVPAMPVD
jgi:UDP-glucose 4-epimerase